MDEVFDTRTLFLSSNRLLFSPPVHLVNAGDQGNGAGHREP
jgi:hypothetical protein